MMENKNIRREKFIVALMFFIGIVLAFLLFVVSEFVSHYYLTKVKNWEGAPQFFYDKTMASASNTNQGVTQGFGAFDPLLGYAHGADFPPKNLYPTLTLERIPGFVVYGNKDDSDAIKIVTLGGSTTDPTTFLLTEERQDNWSKVLHDLCVKNGKNCTILNGGIGGFTSSQELMKFIRDVLPIKPDIVISLTGENDIYHYATSYHFSHHYQIRLMEKLAGKYQFGFKGYFPNTFFILNYLLNKSLPHFPIHQGTPYAASPGETWSNNTRMMNAISKEYSIRYQAFLQPIVGIGKYNLNEDENNYLIQMEKKEQYHSNLIKLYRDAKVSCLERNYCTDLTGLFDNQSDLFSDPRHPNQNGDRIIAQAIYDELVKKNLI